MSASPIQRMSGLVHDLFRRNKRRTQGLAACTF
jgi:hypothetical protein